MKTSTIPQPRIKLLRGTHSYFAIDGGAGANLLADLAGRDPSFQSVASPRHAGVLLIVGPVSNKLVPSLVAIAKSLPHPARVLLLDTSHTELHTFSDIDRANLATIFPEARSVSSLDQLLSVAFDTNLDTHATIHIAHNVDNVQEPKTIQMPQKSEQEMATELAVLSLGPVQPFTAGPLRLFLICDGEQVLSVQVEAGYAHRGIDEAMHHTTWQQALILARHFEPLAPLAGQLAYVRAIEQLQGWQPSEVMTMYREGAIALERVHNALWWGVRMARILADESMLSRAYTLARRVSGLSAHIWQRSPMEWIMPQCEGNVLAEKVSLPQKVLSEMEKLLASVTRNRLLALRTRGIGVLDATWLRQADVTSGFVLDASEPGVPGNKGDIQSRLMTRLQAAQHDMQTITALLATPQQRIETHEANWTVLPGESHATVHGPRGDIGLHLVSDGGDTPVHVIWQHPSAALLSLLPEMLEGQKLTDAELILASLDLSMAEVDG